MMVACRTATPPAAPRVARDAAVASLDVAVDAVALALDAVALDAVSDDVASVEPEAPRPVAYRDEASVAALARDARFTLARGDDGDEAYACASGIDWQSCVPSTCHEGMGRRCRHGCLRVCNGCESSCRAALAACLRGARDEAARLGCARVAGPCIDGCIEAKDRCVTGGCNAREARCEADEERRFRDGPCRPACARCERACEAHDDDPLCRARCARRSGACDQGQVSLCVMIGSAYGSPTTEP